MKYFSAGVIIIMFLVAGFVSGQYTEFFRYFLGEHRLVGMGVYFLATILAIVAAPLSSIPFIPIMVTVWGVFWTVILSIAGWFVGSMLAFGIARKFGAPVVKKLASIENHQNLLKNIPEKRLFWYLLFLRITVPVDILSYALGLFTHISWRLFAVTTLIGIIPTIILLAKVGTFPIEYQVILAVLAVCLLVIGWKVAGKAKQQ